jgi:histidinol-phosphatase
MSARPLSPQELLDAALEISEAAAEIPVRYFRADVAVEDKPDATPVTVADRETEEFIRRAIEARFPDHGILGEEFGGETSDRGILWIIDPIDGTRSFASGVPLYGVLIGLEIEGEPVVGCCHLPGLRETIVAATGAGAWHNGQRASVSSVDRLEEARVTTSGLEYWRGWATPAGHEGWRKLVQSARFVRTWGDCYGYLLVATGRAEIHADPATGAHWDWAPIAPIVAEAGGRFTTFTGAPPGAWTPALATNGAIHQVAMGCWDATAPHQIQEMLAARGG